MDDMKKVDKGLVEDFVEEKKTVTESLKDVLITIFTWLPIGIIGMLFFYFATAFEPTGTLTDMRIKLMMYVGRSFMAVYIGQILWSLLFPTLDMKWFKKDVEAIEPKTYNIMYGRLFLHFIMQIAILNL